MSNKDRKIWIILTVVLLVGGYAFSITSSRAEEPDMENACYINMPKKQVVVCLGSIKVKVEEMVKQTQQLLNDIKPIEVES